MALITRTLVLLLSVLALALLSALPTADVDAAPKRPTHKPKHRTPTVQATQAATSTPTAMSTATRTATSLPSATATPTSVPTSTPTTAATPTSTPVAPPTSVPIFEGWGANTTGGTGGTVYEVTNLADSGPGSLRAAVSASGPRIVVFRVAGTIVLNSRLTISNPYLTIDGQTAPGEGITLRMNPNVCYDKGTLQIETHDVIVRYLRLRPGANACADDTHDALTIYKAGAHDIVIDHVSMSWAVDEVLNTYDYGYNVTIQDSIIAEALSNSTHPEGEHSKGALIGGVGAKQISLLRNLFVSNKDRNPQVSGVYWADVRNNVIYNYGTGSGQGVTLISSSKGTARVNWVGNYYKPGPASDPNRPEFALYVGTTGSTWLYYASGNERWTPSGNQPARLHASATGYSVGEPYPAGTVRTLTAAEAYAYVLANAGASLNRDVVDERLVADVLNGTGQIIDDPAEVGGYPVLAGE